MRHLCLTLKGSLLQNNNDPFRVGARLAATSGGVATGY
jgi:hypothetical protein